MDADAHQSESPVCPHCGARRSNYSPRGLCRRCVARTLLAPSEHGKPVGLSLRVRCPQCGRLMELGEASGLSDICCDSCGTHFSIADEKAASLDRIGQFEILQKLGAGAFGTVWKARDTQLDRVVAIKIPRHRTLDATEARKFLREARAAAQLRHPHLVSVLEVGRQDDLIYIVCDYIEGVPLTEWMAGRQAPQVNMCQRRRVRGPGLQGLVGRVPSRGETSDALHTAREAARLCRQIASALEYAHAQGVIHRDIKPGNIILDARGEPHLTDFGLARREAGEATITLEGQVLGTPAYMSPELARGEAHQADGRTDLYSLGVVLFQLLTGELPFRGNTRMLVHQVIHADPPSPRTLNPHVPRDLETICLKCLEKEPARRYGSARDLGEDLDRFLAGEPVHVRSLGPAGRFWRRCRRKPALTSLSLLLALILGLNFVTLLGRWKTEGEDKTTGADPALSRPAAGNALGDIHYVWPASPDPKPPYSNWATAAHVIQEAVDAAQPGDEVMVTNGLYATGGRTVGTNLLVNRAVVDKPLTLRSVNGPQFTLIEGGKSPGGTNGDGAVRCVYLTNGAALHGFTLTNGATRAWAVFTTALPDHAGGGVFCESTNALVVDCTLISNTCGYAGAGAWSATLSNCTLRGNDAYYNAGGAVASVLTDCSILGNTAGMSGSKGMPIGGGACASVLTRCVLSNNVSSCEGGGAGGGSLLFCTVVSNSAPYGGGVYLVDMANCTLTGNRASDYGGGALCSRLTNCVLTGNSALKAGGGALGGWQGLPSALNNCTLTGNTAPIGGGATDCTLNNCILYANTAPEGPNYSGGTLNNCCTTPMPSRGDNNITADPQLAGAAHLKAGSPCRGAGDWRYISGVDIDGEPWIRPPSIGCDEFRETNGVR